MPALRNLAQTRIIALQPKATHACRQVPSLHVILACILQRRISKSAGLQYRSPEGRRSRLRAARAANLMLRVFSKDGTRIFRQRVPTSRPRCTAICSPDPRRIDCRTDGNFDVPLRQRRPGRRMNRAVRADSGRELYCVHRIPSCSIVRPLPTVSELDPLRPCAQVVANRCRRQFITKSHPPGSDRDMPGYGFSVKSSAAWAGGQSTVSCRRPRSRPLFLRLP